MFVVIYKPSRGFFYRSNIIIFILHILGVENQFWIVFIISFHKQASFWNWVLFRLLGGQDMNRYLTKQGDVARMLIFVCGRWPVSTSSRTLTALT